MLSMTLSNTCGRSCSATVICYAKLNDNTNFEYKTLHHQFIISFIVAKG